MPFRVCEFYPNCVTKLRTILRGTMWCNRGFLIKIELYIALIFNKLINPQNKETW